MRPKFRLYSRLKKMPISDPKQTEMNSNASKRRNSMVSRVSLTQTVP